MRFFILCLFFVIRIHSHIEEVNQESKPPQSVTPFAPILIDYDDSEETTEPTFGELSPPPRSSVYMGRSKRAIHDPVADYLDDKATNAIFNEKQNWGPPSIPPYNYNPTQAPSQQEFITTSRPELPPYTQPPSMIEETTWSQTRTVEVAPSHGGAVMGKKPLPPTGAVVSYDLHVDPDFPVEPPRARGLSEGGAGDAEFSAGYRWKGQPRAGGSSGRNYDIGPRGRGNQAYGQPYGHNSPVYAPSAPVYSTPSSGYGNSYGGYSNSQGSFGYSSGSYGMASAQSYFVPNSNFYALTDQVAQQPLAMSAPPTYSSYGSYSPLMSQASSSSYGSTWLSPSSYVQPGK